MTTIDGHLASAASAARRAEQRRMARWVTSAVWRHRIASDSLTSATVVADALDALGITNEVVPVAVVVDQSDLVRPRLFGNAAFARYQQEWVERRDPGDHAIVLANDAGLALDAAFSRFGTIRPYLVATVEHEIDAWVHRSGEATVTYIRSEQDREISIEDRGLVFAQAMELAGVGTHVAFDQEALHGWLPLFPTWEVLRGALDDVHGLAARRLAAFRTARNDRLAGLGYPWSIQDPYTAPMAVGVAA